MQKKILGYGALAVGVAGLVLPILPGIPFLLLGLTLLGPDHFLTRVVMDRVRRLRGR